MPFPLLIPAEAFLKLSNACMIVLCCIRKHVHVGCRNPTTVTPKVHIKSPLCG